jgi:peptidoglycan/xylan/chitin deacetylase (PgdA/CDA1 family)
MTADEQGAGGSVGANAFAHGLMFHRFRASGAPRGTQGAVSDKEFEQMLHSAGMHNILAPAEWIERLETGSLEGQHVCITFDDGLRSQLEHALPVLDRLNVRAFWFVYTSIFAGQPFRSEIYGHVADRSGGMGAWVADMLSRAPRQALQTLETDAYAEFAREMRRIASYYSEPDIVYRFLRNQGGSRLWLEPILDEMVADRGFDMATLAQELWVTADDISMLSRRGHEIGLHSFSHPTSLAGLPLDQQREQYVRNRSDLESITGVSPRSVAHPLNSYVPGSLDILSSLGVVCGFRANMLAPAGSSVNASPLELARRDSAELLRRLDQGIRVRQTGRSCMGQEHRGSCSPVDR